MASESKKRKYDDSYQRFGFTKIAKGSVELPQCVICAETLNVSALAPCKLKRHLISKYSQLADKLFKLSYF